MTPAPVSRLEMSGIWKSFGGVPVLKGVNLSLDEGEVLALLGQNGAGKSTLIKILCGEYTRDDGVVYIDGKETVFNTPFEAIDKGVRMLPQEISVIPEMSVVENIFIGQLPLRRQFGLPQLDTKRMREEARELLSQLGLDVDPRLLVKDLSVPEQRVVEIARALAGRARVLVMDEPSASLTNQEVARLFEVIDRLRTRGVSVIYISHYLSEVFEISDHIVVLRDGEKTGEYRTRDASHADVVLAMVGNAVDDLYPKEQTPHGETLLEVERLNVEGILHDVSFELKKGEILGVFGLIGSGIGTLGKALFGAAGKTARGKVRFKGQPFSMDTTMQAKALGIGYIAAERKAEGIVPDMTVRENMTLAFLERYTTFGNVSRLAEDEYVDRWMKGLSIKARGTGQKLRYLSGGNQQKVCIARWLVEGVDLLIMDEPTRGVDVGARKEIYAELKTLASRGMAILLVSTDAEEIEGMCDRSIVLNRGVLVGEYRRGVDAKELLDVATQAKLEP